MELDVLYDNHSTRPDLVSGWGFSCLIDGHLLFDTGEDGSRLLWNLKRLNRNPESIDGVVISHDHWDHTGGLWDLLVRRKGLTVYGCPGFPAEFKVRIHALEGNWVESDSFQEIEPGIWVTGTIHGTYKEKPLPEQALVVKTGKGLVIVTGCSHPGVASMVRTIRRAFPGEAVVLLFGGFHLRDEDRESIDAVITDLRSEAVRLVGPCHCTGEKALTQFKKHFGERLIGAGSGKRLKIE